MTQEELNYNVLHMVLKKNLKFKNFKTKSKYGFNNEKQPKTNEYPYVDNISIDTVDKVKPPAINNSSIRQTVRKSVKLSLSL